MHDCIFLTSINIPLSRVYPGPVHKTLILQDYWHFKNHQYALGVVMQGKVLKHLNAPLPEYSLCDPSTLSLQLKALASVEKHFFHTSHPHFMD